MAAYHVFVDGAADRSAAGIERLATAIAGHYGLPIADLRTRLASGRFRVKGNCDRATADSYVRDLTALGARCSVDEATPQNRASTPLPFPAQPPARPSQPPAPLQSGLAAAFSGEMPTASLGALDDGSLLKLSSVDGADDPAPEAVSAFAPPAVATPKPAGPAKPAAAKPAAAKPAAAKPAAASEPVDMFAPPDAEAEAAFRVELADDEVERAAKKRASVPRVEVPVPASAPAPVPAARSSQPSIQAPAAPTGSGLADPKVRFALGVLIAIVLGFIPAHLLASVREHSAFAEIDQKIEKQQREADTPDTYDALDAFRAGQLARKRDERRNIAMLALLVWGIAGAGVAYVWFRRIPWDRAS